jgi:hypothetical protein
MALVYASAHFERATFALGRVVALFFGIRFASRSRAQQNTNYHGNVGRKILTHFASTDDNTRLDSRL